MTHSAQFLSAKKEAEIKFDDSIEGTLEGEYMVVVNNKVEHRTNGYFLAVRFIERKGWSLVNPLHDERGSGRLTMSVNY